MQSRIQEGPGCRVVYRRDRDAGSYTGGTGMQGRIQEGPGCKVVYRRDLDAGSYTGGTRMTLGAG